MKIRNYQDVETVLNEINNTGEASYRLTCRDMSRILVLLWERRRLLPKSLGTEVLVGREGLAATFQEDGIIREVVLELYNDGTGLVLIMKFGDMEESIDLPGDDKERIACQIIMKILQV